MTAQIEVGPGPVIVGGSAEDCRPWARRQARDILKPKHIHEELGPDDAKRENALPKRLEVLSVLIARQKLLRNRDQNRQYPMKYWRTN